MEEQQSIEAVEASMIDPEIVVVIRELKARAWGDRRIARELGLDKKTVKRWLEGPAERKQVRPRARKLDAAGEELARELFVGLAEGNAVVVKDELRRRGVDVSERTVQRVVA